MGMLSQNTKKFLQKKEDNLDELAALFFNDDFNNSESIGNEAVDSLSYITNKSINLKKSAFLLPSAESIEDDKLRQLVEQLNSEAEKQRRYDSHNEKEQADELNPHLTKMNQQQIDSGSQALLGIMGVSGHGWPVILAAFLAYQAALYAKDLYEAHKMELFTEQEMFQKKELFKEKLVAAYIGTSDEQRLNTLEAIRDLMNSQGHDFREYLDSALHDEKKAAEITTMLQAMGYDIEHESSISNENSVENFSLSSEDNNLLINELRELYQNKNEELEQIHSSISLEKTNDEVEKTLVAAVEALPKKQETEIIWSTLESENIKKVQQDVANPMVSKRPGKSM